VAGTWGIDNILQDTVMDAGLKKVIISVTGPGVEKLGFFPQHFYNAWRTYRNTPQEQRKKFSYYFGQGCKNGLSSLVKDLIIHDPLYIGGMMVGQTYFQDIPPYAIAAASFVGAVAIVAGVSVGVEELKYHNLKRKLTDSGFLVEPSYFEGRFLIEKKYDPISVMHEIADKFGLKNMRTFHYHDKYFAHTMKGYNNRAPKLRLRERETEGGFMRTAQVIQTRTRMIKPRRESSYNYYPCTKEKIYFHLEQGIMPWTLEYIESEKARDALLKLEDKNIPPLEIEFERTLANDPDIGFISADNVSQSEGRPFHVMEIKSRSRSILKEAMETLMRYSVDQTTASKLELAQLYKVYSSQPTE